MADRIKTVSTYNGTSWGSEVPIGADASNVDVTLSNNTKSDLQTVLGSTPSGSSVTERINSKISTSGGDVADTVVSKNITNYDSSTDAGSDILTDTAATVNTNTSSLWSRFNLFRKKVSNNFNNYFATANLVGANPGVSATGTDDTVYTTAALNNYFSNVIGYESASTPDAGSVASQLSTLNNNFLDRMVYNSSLTLNNNSYVAMAGTITLNDSSTNPTWITYNTSVDTPFIYIQSGTQRVGIYNQTSGRLRALFSFRCRVNLTTDANYTGVIEFQMWRKKAGSDYELHRYIGSVAAAVSAYPRAYYSYAWVDEIPQGGAVGLRAYRDSTHTTSATLMQGALMVLPLTVNS